MSQSDKISFYDLLTFDLFIPVIILLVLSEIIFWFIKISYKYSHVAFQPCLYLCNIVEKKTKMKVVAITSKTNEQILMWLFS